jgi:hypothetical protein
LRGFLANVGPLDNILEIMFRQDSLDHPQVRATAVMMMIRRHAGRQVNRDFVFTNLGLARQLGGKVLQLGSQPLATAASAGKGNVLEILLGQLVKLPRSFIKGFGASPAAATPMSNVTLYDNDKFWHLHSSLPQY